MKITLCGSTKFKSEFERFNALLSKQGHLVYSVASFGHAGDPMTPEEKKTLDAVHLKKIEESEAILVIDVAGYVGDSTSREIAHARNLGRKVFWHSGLLGALPHERRICPYPGCRDSLGEQPCPMCYE